MLTFQEIILTLTAFWEKEGCIIHQGYDLEVGAGTFNPATFLRCLGPEPYSTVYTEPSRRPSDGRYGENPNRLQLFHQLQVIIKPSPNNIQQLYLRSLEALGLNLKAHDIRFVHDDWESPTLGAWGLGWEVWCDGMEITQFTYFQAIGSIPLPSISVEITYGLERLAMFIQNVDNIFSVKWNDTLTFDDISKQSEIEWSTYNFTEASTAMWHRHFEDFEKEAKVLAEKHLPLPAYDFVLKASHAFNILDARGAISVTERTGYIARIRDLARLIAEEYLFVREQKGFPLLSKETSSKKSLPLQEFSKVFDTTKKRDFLLEIGSEQLPATFIPIGMKGLESSFTKFFQEKGLSFENVQVFGTPQRLAVLVSGLSEGLKESSLEKKGPPISSAFDENGKATALGAGFLKSIGLLNANISLQEISNGSISSLEVRNVKETAYLFYTKKEPSLSTIELLANSLAKLILQLDFPKKMRWGQGEISYARPLRWILALFGEEVIPFHLEETTSDRYSQGHAQLDPTQFIVPSPKEYLSLLKTHFVLADPKERTKRITAEILAIETKLGLKAICQDRVLPQVLNLTEWPTILSSTFNETFLKAPSEVLISEMVEHQKYFPLVNAKNELVNTFLITTDNTPSELIIKGNNRVLSARLFDGVFLYEQDVKIQLTQFNEKLKVMTFQKALGSMFEKVQRLIAHAKTLNQILLLADEKTVERAASLCKADLASSLVGEFPELQGTIGKYYARAQREQEQIAVAIEEHWMPKSESAPLPKTPCGILLSLADKVDNLLGYFSIGLKPTSSSDPYALKRQTFGLLKILIEEKLTLNLKELFTLCSKSFSQAEVVIDEVLLFLTNRAKSLLEEYGFKKDEIEASLQGLCIDPFLQFSKVEALHAFRKTEDFSLFYEVYKRIKGFLGTPSSHRLDINILTHPAEKTLISVLDKINHKIKDHLAHFQFLDAFLLLAEIQKPLSSLLEQVKIQADDEVLKENRIALIAQVFSLFDGLLDFNKIQEG